jgi:hypothetical protein
MIDEKQRAEKIALSDLKEKISMFLYNHFIDFERDRGVVVQNKVVHPNFILNKHGIVIECFRVAEPENPEFTQKAQMYISGGIKFLPMDLRVLANNKVDQALRELLPKMGCRV